VALLGLVGRDSVEVEGAGRWPTAPGALERDAVDPPPQIGLEWDFSEEDIVSD
jgi:hypothetical protein